MEELIIEAGRAEKNYWRDLWRYRELFYFLAWRDILVRYKQTVIGIAWAVIRPLLTTIVLVFAFSRVAKLHGLPDVPYPLMVFAAMLPWQFFATSMSEASNSLILNANLVSKIYFPRLIVPAGSVITSFVDFLITVALLGLMLIWYQFMPDWRLLALPLFVVLAFVVAFGTGLWLCALNVKYRDFRYVVPFVVQFGFFISPVGFALSDVPQKWQTLYALNPMVGVINGFHWCLLRGKEPLNISSVVLSVTMAAVLLATGIRYFRKMEKTFADVI